ncbi:MAG: type II toxin-antitoxin system RelE/ParE family toxin [Acidobacteriota bacterium]
MIEVRQTDLFASWLLKLRDQEARQRIQIRIRRVSLGNFGDVKPVGEGVSELRVDYGPGYRIYLAQRGTVVVILLVGGTKQTQQSDIAKAKQMAKELSHAREDD